MRTSDPDIYAAGDCVESTDLVTGKPCYVPMGSTANKQGRVAAINICGGQDQFPGVLGSTVCRVFDFCVARTGLTEAAARQHGYEMTTVVVPDARPASLHAHGEAPHHQAGGGRAHAEAAGRPGRGAGRGRQAHGRGRHGDHRRHDRGPIVQGGPLLRAALFARPGQPHHGGQRRPQQAGRPDGRHYVERGQAARWMRKKDFVLLDVRSPAEHQQERLAGSTLIPLGALRSRLGELPRDKEIVTFCKVSLRGYEAAKILPGRGFPECPGDGRRHNGVALREALWKRLNQHYRPVPRRLI